MHEEEKKITKSRFYNIKSSLSYKTREDVQRTYHISSSTVSDINSSPSFEHYVMLIKDKARKFYKQRNSFRVVEKGHQMQRDNLSNPFGERIGQMENTLNANSFSQVKKYGKGHPLPKLTEDEFSYLIGMVRKGFSKEEMARNLKCKNAAQMMGRVKKDRAHELKFMYELEQSKALRAERVRQTMNMNLEKSPMRTGEFSKYASSKAEESAKNKVKNRTKLINGMPAEEFYKQNMAKARAAIKRNNNVKCENNICTKTCANCECDKNAQKNEKQDLEIKVDVLATTNAEISILTSGLFMSAVLVFMAMINVLTIEPLFTLLPIMVAVGIFVIKKLLNLYAVCFMVKAIEKDNKYKLKQIKNIFKVDL